MMTPWRAMFGNAITWAFLGHFSQTVRTCQGRLRGLRFPPMNEALGYFLGKPRANLKQPLFLKSPNTLNASICGSIDGQNMSNTQLSNALKTLRSAVPVSCLGTGSVLILPAPSSFSPSARHQTPSHPGVSGRIGPHPIQFTESHAAAFLTQEMAHISHMADLGLNFVRKAGSFAQRSAKSSKASLMLSFFTNASSNNSKAGANRRPSPKT